MDHDFLYVRLSDLQTLSPAEAVVLAYIAAVADYAAKNPHQWQRFSDAAASRVLGLSKVGNVLKRLEALGRLESRWPGGRKSREVRFAK